MWREDEGRGERTTTGLARGRGAWRENEEGCGERTTRGVARGQRGACRARTTRASLALAVPLFCRLCPTRPCPASPPLLLVPALPLDRHLPLPLPPSSLPCLRSLVLSPSPPLFLHRLRPRSLPSLLGICTRRWASPSTRLLQTPPPPSQTSPCPARRARGPSPQGQRGRAQGTRPKARARPCFLF